MAHPKEKMVRIQDLPSFIPTQRFIKQEEGLKLITYRCPAGYKTAGWGHVVEACDDLKLGDSITKEQAEQWFKADVTKAYQALFRLVYVPLTDNQQTALVSFIFNFGDGRFQASTLRQKLNRQEYDAAAQEFGRWVYVRHPTRGWVKAKGLASRRHREALLFLRKTSHTSSPKARPNIFVKHLKPNLPPLQSIAWQKAASAWTGLFKMGW